ncbi:MAG: hypothetical protein HOC94_05320 [Waddliaceae bacterium]|nr:hypothetical protein [Waddliaceae bacterium]
MLKNIIVIVSMLFFGSQLIASPFSSDVENTLKTSIASVYGSDKCDEVYDGVMAIAENVLSSRSAALREEEVKRPAGWHKDEVMYMFYADQFGTIDGRE